MGDESEKTYTLAGSMAAGPDERGTCDMDFADGRETFEFATEANEEGSRVLPRRGLSPVTLLLDRFVLIGIDPRERPELTTVSLENPAGWEVIGAFKGDEHEDLVEELTTVKTGLLVSLVTVVVGASVADELGTAGRAAEVIGVLESEIGTASTTTENESWLTGVDARRGGVKSPGEVLDSSEDLSATSVADNIKADVDGTSGSFDPGVC